MKRFYIVKRDDIHDKALEIVIELGGRHILSIISREDLRKTGSAPEIWVWGYLACIASDREEVGCTILFESGGK